MQLKKLIKNKYIWSFLTYLFIMTILPIGIQLLLDLFRVGTTKSISFGSYEISTAMMSVILNFLILFIILGFIMFLYFKTSLFQWRKPIIKGKDFLYALFVFIGGKFVTVIVMVIIALLFGLNMEEAPQNQQAVEVLIHTSYITIIQVTILAPIIEEFFFRKVIIGHVFSKYKYVGLIFSSLLFGGMHMMAGFSLTGMILYSGLGFFLGLVYIRTNRIETSIIAHGFNNLVSYLLVLLIR
ncbi:CPBP family intramembrane metalloprotease [Niallia circulans]|uniref:CPBP family intramembrane metalloprotease n=1 Tax=Niallia circulans TaxID=1397 RepID=A0A553SUH6_NIACI|nr:CPBP family intramembrane metalloprotease [Niallia circulans]